MKPTTKTLLIVLLTISSVFLFPAIIVVFRDYLNAFFAITLFITCFILFGYNSYQMLLPIIRREQLEEEEIMQRFAGDKEKIRFYRGFKKYFNGDLNAEELERWFIKHPRKNY